MENIESNVLEMNPDVKTEDKNEAALAEQMNKPEAFDGLKMRLDAAALKVAAIRDYVNQMSSPEVEEAAKNLKNSEEFINSYKDAATYAQAEINSFDDFKRMTKEAEEEISQMKNDLFSQAA